MQSESEYVHLLLENLDYDAQFLAIRRLLCIQQRDRRELEKEIEKYQKIAEQSTGAANQYAVDEWAYSCQKACYQEAAYSMAAVGMIAPFTESVFQHAFPKHSKRILYGKKFPRMSLEDKVMKLVEEVGIEKCMPGDLKPTLSALFTYRNRMFHNGLEWPQRELKKFAKRLDKADWPTDWFSRATSMKNHGCSICPPSSSNTA